jgi:hypothetical protein
LKSIFELLFRFFKTFSMASVAAEVHS